MYKKTDLVIISLWTIASVFSVVFSEFEYIGYIKALLGIPVVLFIPGYILVAALFPKKDDLNIAERIALSIGISIAVIILLGSLLSFTFGITLIPIIIILCLYTAIFVVITVYRREKLRKKLPEDVIFSVEFDKNKIVNYLKPKDNIDLALNIILIIIVTLAIVMSYYTITSSKIGERFTEFYILDSSGADNYSTIINSSITVLIGVVNHEDVSVNYTVQTVLDKNILASEKLILKNHGVWEKNVTLAPTLQQNKENVKLEFLLFKEDNLTTPYRTLHLWVS